MTFPADFLAHAGRLNPAGHTGSHRLTAALQGGLSVLERGGWLGDPPWGAGLKQLLSFRGGGQTVATLHVPVPPAEAITPTWLQGRIRKYARFVPNLCK